MSSALYRKPPGHSTFRAGPLVEFIVERRDGRELGELADDCGVSVRALRELLAGRTRMVRIGTADRVTMGLGGHLDDVYPYEEPICQRDRTNGQKLDSPEAPR